MSETPSPTTTKSLPIATSSHERIWGKAVLANGYTALPSIMIRAQSRLQITPLQFNILAQLLDYWRDPGRAPFPSKSDLANRIGCNHKTIQINIRILETRGFVRREMRRTKAGDWNSNIYHLTGLVDRIQDLEPEFTEVRKRRLEAKLEIRNAQKEVQKEVESAGDFA